MELKYRKTVRACYLGIFCMALVCNITPLLFISIRNEFSLSFEMLGGLAFINYVTQIATDLIFSKPIDRHGPRPFVVLGLIFGAVGMVIFAVLPRYTFHPYLGLAIGTVIFSFSSGLMEILLSPIVQAIPSENKAGEMSGLHSFYAWGLILTVVIVTLLLKVMKWNYAVILLSVIPFIAGIIFCFVPLAPWVEESRKTKMGSLLKSGVFYLILFGILTGGASEVAVAQWTSAYSQDALGLRKEVGDLVGVILFALLMAIGRSWFAKKGSEEKTRKYMLIGGILTLFCYIVTVFSRSAAVSLVAVSLCGLFTALMWPGSLILATQAFPFAGAGMFALMAAAGDTGAALGPYVVGVFADMFPQYRIKAGLLFAAVFPLVFTILTLSGYMKRRNQKSKSSEL